MSKESNDQKNIDSQETSVGEGLSRRKLIKAGVISAPVVMSLPGKTALATGGGGACVLSGMLSGNVSDQGGGTNTCEIVCGKSPGYWKQCHHKDAWPVDSDTKFNEIFGDTRFDYTALDGTHYEISLLEVLLMHEMRSSGNCFGTSTFQCEGSGSGEWTGSGHGYFSGDMSGYWSGTGSGYYYGDGSGTGTEWDGDSYSGTWSGTKSGSCDGYNDGYSSGTGTGSYTGSGSGYWSGTGFGCHPYTSGHSYCYFKYKYGNNFGPADWFPEEWKAHLCSITQEEYELARHSVAAYLNSLAFSGYFVTAEQIVELYITVQNGAGTMEVGGATYTFTREGLVEQIIATYCDGLLDDQGSYTYSGSGWGDTGTGTYTGTGTGSYSGGSMGGGGY